MPDTYPKKFLLKWFGLWAAVSCLTGLFVLHLFPRLYGWAAGHVIGGLFAKVLARHDTLFLLVTQGLSGLYTLLALTGFDFLFLFMVYMGTNTVFKLNGTRADIAGVAGRALKGLLVVQLVAAACFFIFAGHQQTVLVYMLIPPFLTQSAPASIYMAVWEIALFLFAFGYAVTEDSRKAWGTGIALGLPHFIILFAAAGVFMLLTWLPGLCTQGIHLPTWVLTCIGLWLHSLCFNGLVLWFLHQPDIRAVFTPDTTH